MELRIKRRITLICMVLAAVLLMASMQTYGKAAKPKLVYYLENKTVVRDYPGKHFSVSVENPVKGAKYSATVSDEKVAKLVNVGINSYDGTNFFYFYAKKSGKVKITVKQTLNKKTKKIGSVTFTIKSKKLSAKDEKKEKLLQKVINSGNDSYGNGVSLEVLQITNIKNTKDKVTAKVKLRHKVTADEAKLAKNGFDVWASSKDNTIIFEGKLKKGSQYVTVSAKKKDDYAKKALKKGLTYYVTGLNTKKNSPYRLKVKL